MSTYCANKEEVLMALSKTLQVVIKREVVLTENSKKELEVLRVNNNSTITKVAPKAFKKAKKLFIEQMENIAKKREKEAIISMIKKGEIHQGTILNQTPNGFFVAIKGNKAFISFKNMYNKDSLTNGDAFYFEVIYVSKNGKIFLNRRSNKVFEKVVSNIVGRYIKLKKIRKGFLAFIDKPYIDEHQQLMIKASLPADVIFKKIKEV